MKLAQNRSESSVQRTVVPGKVESTVIYRFDHAVVKTLIWPITGGLDTDAQAQFAARKDEIEKHLAEQEHARFVEQALRASVNSLADAWDNPLDAQYDDL